MNEPAKQPLELPAATYEPQLSASIDLERGLSSEVLLHVFDLSGTHEVKTCYGDVVKNRQRSAGLRKAVGTGVRRVGARRLSPGNL